MSFDVIVIGSGPGGYVAAIRCAQLGLKTACIEKEEPLGGTCLNVGCIPSKTLLHATELLHTLQTQGPRVGLGAHALSVDFSRMMQTKAQIVGDFNRGIEALFKKNRIERIRGLATLRSATEVQVGDTVLQAKQIVLATGSAPIPLPFLPFDETKILSSTGALSLPAPPKSMAVIGAGIVGVEIGSIYRRLGTEITFFEMLDRICPTLDESLSKGLQKELEAQGMHFLLSTKIQSASVQSDRVLLKTETQEHAAQVVLVAIGRRPYTQQLGLERVGIVPSAQGVIPVDGRFRTSVATIFAIGDLIDGPMLAHKASEEGVAVAQILAGQEAHIDYMAIPSVAYTYPEAAGVGLTEREAAGFGLSLHSGLFPFKANSRARCVGEEEGFVKILCEQNSGRVVGMHILGAQASELIHEGVFAIEHRLTAKQLAQTPRAHPTLSEAIKEAALAVERRAIHR